MRVFGPQRGFSLAAKLGVGLVVSTSLILAVFGYLNLRLQKRQAQELVLQSSERIGDLIRSSANYEMLHNDRQGLQRMISDVAAEPGIRRVRIFNPQGRISFSSDPAEINTVVDKNAEACYVCHARGAAVASLERKDRTRYLREGRDGTRYLATIRPIENHPSCSSASCHVHPADQKVLGVIDTHLSLATVDAQIASHQKQLIGFTALALAMISGVSAAFMWLVATKSAELERAQSTLIESDKLASLGKLAATVAHEVNNPLFGILTYARLSLKELASGSNGASLEAIKERLQIIERESKRCGELVRNLLAFARQAPKRSERNDLNAVIDRTMALIRHRFEPQGIQLRTELAPGLPAILCDAGQIEQVVLALAVNAIEAMSKGGELHLRTAFDAASGRVVLKIRDTGPGIPADALPHLFEPFFTTKRDQHRTGLGLAVARGIVEQHGGEIRVNSRPGAGTEFTILLPLETAAKDGAGS